MIVKNILQNKAQGQGVVFVDPGVGIDEAVRMLAKHRIGAMVAVESSGKIAGIISERDIIRGLSEKAGACLTLRVSDLMTSNVLTCHEQDTIDSVMETMTSKRIRHLPVVDAAGKLAGIVTIGDVVKISLDQAHMEVNDLRDYVAAVR